MQSGSEFESDHQHHGRQEDRRGEVERAWPTAGGRSWRSSKERKEHTQPQGDEACQKNEKSIPNRRGESQHAGRPEQEGSVQKRDGDERDAGAKDYDPGGAGARRPPPRIASTKRSCSTSRTTLVMTRQLTKFAGVTG